MAADELVVTHHTVTDIDSLHDLAGREVHVLRNSSYAEHLRSLNKQLAAKGLAAIRPLPAPCVSHHRGIPRRKARSPCNNRN